MEFEDLNEIFRRVDCLNSRTFDPRFIFIVIMAVEILIYETKLYSHTTTTAE